MLPSDQGAGQTATRRLAVKNGHDLKKPVCAYFAFFSCSRAPARMPGSA